MSNESEGFIIDNSEMLKRAIEYYSKSLKNLEEEEELDETIPLFKGKIGQSLLEARLIQSLLDSGASSDLNQVKKKLDFVSSILEYYKDELTEDLEELENTKGHKDIEVKLLEEEIEKISIILQKLEFFGN